MLDKNIFVTYPFLPRVFIILAVIELILKGFALYRSAKNDQKYWFIAILIVNSIGILPLVYLLLHSKKKNNK